MPQKNAIAESSDDLDEIGLLLREVSRLHARSQRLLVSCQGITVAECHVFSELGRFGSMSMSELVKRLGLHKGWVSRTVASLVKNGYLDRAANESDNRQIILSLTKIGKERFNLLEMVLNDASSSSLVDVPPMDRIKIRQSLEIIRNILREPMNHGESYPTQLPKEGCR